MENRTQGAWLISHTKKLQEINTQDFEDIELAGKCGIFLSNLAASDEQSDINIEKVNAIAKVSNIKKIEIETIKSKLADSRLIDVSSNGSISVIGVTTSAVLSYTSNIFLNDNPSAYQRAALELSNVVSDLPKGEKLLAEYISDSHKLSNNETYSLLSQASEIGFIDNEILDDETRFYFNGNLFKRDVATKTNAILSTLKADEIQNIASLDEILTKDGCTTVEQAKYILGETLLAKLQSIGMYDFNEVSNPKEIKTFVTKPAAFSKFGNPFEEDALDLAKSFVSALYYGMNFSSSGRGRISMLGLLMRKLVNGGEVGPATAIGQDYNLLEFKRVISIRKEPGTNRFYMKLLKRDVGELALQVLQFGDAVEQTVINTDLYSGSVTHYNGPEEQRTKSRKKQNIKSKGQVAELLNTLRS